jgi:hypothetical protein
MLYSGHFSFDELREKDREGAANEIETKLINAELIDVKNIDNTIRIDTE